MNVAQGDQPPFPLVQSIDDASSNALQDLRDAYLRLQAVQGALGIWDHDAPAPAGTRAQRRAERRAAGTTRWGRGWRPGGC